MAYLVPGANAPARLANMIAMLRRRLGYGTDATIFTDLMAMDALNEALRQINAHWPLYVTGFFPTVANQQHYTGVLPVGGNQLVTVFWCGVGCGCATDGAFGAWAQGFYGELAAAFGDVTEQGYWYAIAPSILVILNRHRSYINRFFGRRAAISDRTSVHLIPPPAVSGTRVYFVYTANRFDAPENVTDEIPEIGTAFWAKALSVASGGLAGGNNAITRVVGADGVSVTLGASGAAQAAVSRYDAEFEACLPLGMGMWDNSGCG